MSWHFMLGEMLGLVVILGVWIGGGLLYLWLLDKFTSIPKHHDSSGTDYDTDI